MEDLRDRLARGLAARYRLEREIGHGGMAVVYLARDLRHGRTVAVKVLRPELAVALGSERFLREIEIAAGLSHPNILPLYDSGTVEGLLYYVMPYVVGESLRARLDRERHLPIDDVLAITTQVAAGLSFAHERGLVHRDVKPENILLEGDRAIVADFGIARAIRAAGGERLTETGVAVGTPSYMSPEQATAERELDGRSDVYSLGCVVYEMLVAEPPYTGPSAQAILARRFSEPVPSLRTVRDVPIGVERAVIRALARVPADRFASATDFAEALRKPDPATPSDERRPVRVRGLLLGLSIAVLLLAGLVAVRRWWLPSGPAPNPSLVAVFPFRVSGAEPSLGYLRDGMVDLLAVKLTGEGGPKAIDPTVVLHAWRRSGGSGSTDLDADQGVRVVRSLGAGRLIQGAVVGTASHLTLSAAVTRFPGRGSSIPVTVEGPLDSLSSLVDRLVASVLAGEAGQTSRLADLATTSLPALRAYLDGQAAYRRGRYEEARRLLQQALAFDSTFALAGLSLHSVAAWSSMSDDGGGLRLAWASRQRLSPRDRTLLLAAAGPNYPEPSALRQRLDGWRQAVSAAPDRPEAWYELGDLLYHFGRLLEVPDSWAGAEDAFRRALALDPGAAGPLEHLVEMAQMEDDTATVRRLATRALAADSASEIAPYLRWHLALARGDSSALDRMRSGYSRMSNQSLARLVLFSQEKGVRIGDVAPAISAVRPSPGWQTGAFATNRMETMLNLGRPSQALAQQRLISPEMVVAGAIYGDGDTAAAALAAAELARRADRPLPRDRADREQQVRDLCMLEQWRLWGGDSTTAARTLDRLRDAADPGDRGEAAIQARWCSTLLQVSLATGRGAPDAPVLLARLDSLERSGPVSYFPFWWNNRYGSLVAARLHQALGDSAGALVAVRRRVFYWATADYLAAYLREEGRLAAALGDRDGAIRAYGHYLVLRENPEPALASAVEGVRRELTVLEGS